MKRSLLLILGLLLAGGSAQTASAQIFDPPIGRGRNPLAYASLSIGWLNQQGLCDQDSNACWEFGSAPQWRATFEFPMGRGASFGVAGTMARVPLVYLGSVLGPNSCTQCDADANISQIMGLLRLGGGSTGFHQVVDVNAGVTLLSNFRATGGGQLGTGKTTQDFSFGLGYGFGYNFSPRTEVMIVQDYGLIIHKRQSGNQERTAQQSTIRLGVRVGLGG